jgi:HK97 family phage prohead protease
MSLYHAAMTFGDRVRAVFGMRPRTFDQPRAAAFSGPVLPVDQLLLYAANRVGRIDRARALQVPAVLRARNMICAIGTLPLEEVDANNRVVPSELLAQTDPNVANEVMMAMTFEDLFFDAIAWWEVTDFGPDGYPAAAVRHDPSTVRLQPDDDYMLGRLPSGEATYGTVWMDGHIVPPERVIRFDSPNPAFLVAGEKAIRRAITLDEAAELFASSPRMRGFFAPADPSVDPASDEKIIAALDDFALARKKRLDGYVPAALKYNPIQDPTPAELQLLQMQQRADLAIANATGLDPEDLGINTTSRTYQNATDRRQDKINDVLAPYMTAITGRLSMPDVSLPGRRARFRLDDYLKADPLTRAQVDQIYIGQGVTDPAEVRQENGQPPRVILRPAAPAALAAADAGAEPTAALSFAREGDLTFDSGPDAVFAVDSNRRTITGLAVPWGQSAKSRGRRYRFAKGGIKWSATNRVKLLRDHVNSSAIGKAVHLEDTDQGLVATFRISPGASGDEALALAADGVLDGLSIGVDFRDEDVRPDPEQPGVYLVSQAALREVSLTAVPSFDDSRLTSVTATRDGGQMHTCEHCGAQLTPGVAHTCPTPAAAPATAAATPAAAAAPDNPSDAGAVTFSADQFTQFLARLGAPAPVPAGGVRPTVNPAAHPAPGPAQVVEPLPYRFSFGGSGRYVFASDAEHDLSSDLMTIARSAAEHTSPGDALTRVNGMIKETFAVASAVSEARARATFDVGTDDTTDITQPHRYRADMWQAQLQYPTPLWDMVAAGTTDGVKFDIPEFNSSSGLVGAATPGTEPDPGAFSAKLQTITPSQVWGKVEVLRQAWRIGGNPALSGILWAQMMQEYFEDREAAVATFLNTLTAAADITLTGTPATTPDNDDDQVTVNDLEAAIADLQFARGGRLLRSFAVAQALYRVLARVKDDSGRPLYPQISPQNANGATATGYTYIDVAGVRAVPAYALGAPSTNAVNSWLFAASKVFGWASAPERLFWDFGATVQTANLPQLSYVTLGIYGDVAFGNTDIAGVRQVIFDASV